MPYFRSIFLIKVAHGPLKALIDLHKDTISFINIGGGFQI